MKTIVVSTHKGGAAKTTTAFNVAINLAMQGSRVLAVDMDPQGNMSVAMGADLEELEINRRTSHRMMLDQNAEMSNFMLRARPRLDSIPSCVHFEADGLTATFHSSRDVAPRAWVSAFMLRARPRLDHGPSCVGVGAKGLIETFNISRDLLLRNRLIQ